MRACLPLGILLAAALSRPLASQENGAFLEGILRAEDRRARGGVELALLVRGLSSRDTLVLRGAIRALGRLERPALAVRLFPLLAHPQPGVRGEAVQAVAQAAQGFRNDSFPARRGPRWRAIVSALGRSIPRERDPFVRGMLALSLGRLPYGTPEEIEQAREWLLSLAETGQDSARVAVARGLTTLARLTARRVPLPERFLARLRALARDADSDAEIRRVALGGLLAVQAGDSATLLEALASADPQLRRLAVGGAARLSAGEPQQRLLRAGLGDPAGMVRYEALGTLARSAGRGACVSLAAATRDSVAAVALQALDLLGPACAGDSAAADLLAESVRDSRGPWQRAAHALVSLARVAPLRAEAALRAVLAAPPWQTRLYAARAAAVLRDSGALRRLAADSVANVREAALTGLAALTGHADDGLYRAALGGSDYQLVLTAATALTGSPDRAAATAPLLAALERITRDSAETSRDVRVALLRRLRELGRPGAAPRLMRYLGDFDPVVADSAAALLAAWTGKPQRATPRRLAPAAISLREIKELRGKRLRFTLGSGASFEVELLADDAPLTVLLVARLVARGYYDGLSFHRVVANFVIQGGSPGANEYAGHPRFMRDELGPLSHRRGTLGISTRGRDTGDAQLFVNLVDNPRLDFEYTVWGRVVSGLATVDAVLEGDVIRRVELR